MSRDKHSFATRRLIAAKIVTADDSRLAVEMFVGAYRTRGCDVRTFKRTVRAGGAHVDVTVLVAREKKASVA